MQTMRTYIIGPKTVENVLKPILSEKQLRPALMLKFGNIEKLDSVGF